MKAVAAREHGAGGESETLVTSGRRVRAVADKRVACALVESNEQGEDFGEGRRRDDMQLEHGPVRVERSKIGGTVRGTWSYRSYGETRSTVSSRGPRLPSVLTALTCSSRARSVDGYEHPSSLARSPRRTRETRPTDCKHNR